MSDRKCSLSAKPVTRTSSAARYNFLIPDSEREEYSSTSDFNNGIDTSLLHTNSFNVSFVGDIIKNHFFATVIALMKYFFTRKLKDFFPTMGLITLILIYQDHCLRGVKKKRLAASLIQVTKQV